MATFPTGVAAKPANITDGLQILATHVGTAWDEIVSLENELLGSGAGAFIMDIRPSAAGNVILQSRQLAGDSQPRFQLTGSGDQRWGPGSAATDITLSRSGTRTLTLTGSEVITPGNAADTGLTVKGAGSQTGALMEAQNSSATVFFRITAGGQVILSPAGTPTTAAFGIQFGNDAFANLYRSTNSTLKMDGNLVLGGNVTANQLVAGPTAGAGIVSTNTSVATFPFLRANFTGDSQDRFSSDHNGLLKWGPGGATVQDTTLARTGVGILGLTGALTVSNNLTVSGTASVASLGVTSSGTSVTPAVDDTTTNIATTAFVINQASAVTPNVVDGRTAAAVGTSKRYARADHTHKLSTGIYDSTGNSSRLNPMRLWVFYEQFGGALDGYSQNGKELRPTSGTNTVAAQEVGWGDSAFGSAMHMVPWDRTGLAAIGGTLQWRWQVFINVSTAASGGCTFNGRFLVVADTGGAGTLTAVAGLTSISLGTTTGGKVVDSGWQNVPASSDGLLIPGFRFDKPGGGTDFIWARSQLIIDVRNI